MTFGNAFGLALYDKELANVAGGNGFDAKAKFVAECTRAIGQFDNVEALLRWWNSDSSKRSRRDLHFTCLEIEDLKALVLQRKARLSAPVKQAARRS
jgi:DNA repair and recombination protein RAD52